MGGGATLWDHARALSGDPIRNRRIAHGVFSPVYVCAQMHDSHVTLIVPARLHKQYPKGTPMTILDIKGFVQEVKKRLA